MSAEVAKDVLCHFRWYVCLSLKRKTKCKNRVNTCKENRAKRKDTEQEGKDMKNGRRRRRWKKRISLRRRSTWRRRRRQYQQTLPPRTR